MSKSVPKRESLESLKVRAEALENAQPLSAAFVKFALPSMGLTLLLLFINLFEHLNFFWVLVALASLSMTVFSSFLWFQTRKAEEFEIVIRRKKLRDLSGSNKCRYLDGNLPDGRGRLGTCTNYSFTLDELPYCLYCREYSPPGTATKD